MRQPWPRSASPKQIRAEVVLVARDAGEQRERRARVAPAASEPEQPATQQRAREVLLRDRDLAALPALAQLVEVGQDGIAQDRLDGEGGQQRVERGVRSRVVEASRAVRS